MYFRNYLRHLALVLILSFFLCACANDRMINLKSKAVSMDDAQAHLSSRYLSVVSMDRGVVGSRVNVPASAFSRENYTHREENGFKETLQSPLSTFSVDVDTASYSNVRRMLKQNKFPQAGAVRTEELINYFDYDYPFPQGDAPVSLVHELSGCPWAEGHQLLHIGLKAKPVDMRQAPQSNLVFLIDVSGSMRDDLDLVKTSLRMLTGQLRTEDRVAIVVYAGAAGTVLKPTQGNDTKTIEDALDRLQAGGSTAGSKGIELAYQMAEQNFIKEGNNRVILATDGDFNVGVTSEAALVRLIEKKRDKGIFLTVLGFGSGNYDDAKSESLADHGNGNYSYIDNLLEAKKVLVQEAGGTLVTVAKDVKLQVEFNPTKVKSYRLIGYENRLLNTEDFADDKKDAGDMGAGHTVTALYEIIPTDSEAEVNGKLRYQQTTPSSVALHSNELALIKYRYKEPKDESSKLLSQAVAAKSLTFEKSSLNHQFSATVAAWGMLLRKSDYKGNISFAWIKKTAGKTKGKDLLGDRGEFIRLVELSEILTGE